MRELMRKILFKVNVRLFTHIFGHPCSPRNCEHATLCRDVNDTLARITGIHEQCIRTLPSYQK